MLWWVDPGSLRAVQPAFAALARSVDDIGTRLAAALDAQGDCWGRDRTGATFARGYLPAAGRIREVLPGLRDAVRGVGDALLLVANETDAVDDRAQRRFG